MDDDLTRNELRDRYEVAVDWLAKIIEWEAERTLMRGTATLTPVETEGSRTRVMAQLEQIDDIYPSAGPVVHDVLARLIARGHPLVVRPY